MRSQECERGKHECSRYARSARTLRSASPLSVPFSYGGHQAGCVSVVAITGPLVVDEENWAVANQVGDFDGAAEDPRKNDRRKAANPNRKQNC